MAAEDGPRGVTIMAALHAAQVEFVAALPDIWTSAGLLWPLSKNPDFRLIRLCKEDEGVSICTALSFCQRRAVLMMQHTGLLDSVNALRTTVEYERPLCMIVGLLQKEPDRTPSQSARYGVRIVEPILDALGIEHFCIEHDDDVARLAPAIERAYGENRVLAALIGHRVRP